MIFSDIMGWIFYQTQNQKWNEKTMIYFIGFKSWLDYFTAPGFQWKDESTFYKNEYIFLAWKTYFSEAWGMKKYINSH